MLIRIPPPARPLTRHTTCTALARKHGRPGGRALGRGLVGLRVAWLIRRRVSSVKGVLKSAVKSLHPEIGDSSPHHCLNSEVPSGAGLFLQHADRAGSE